LPVDRRIFFWLAAVLLAPLLAGAPAIAQSSSEGGGLQVAQAPAPQGQPAAKAQTPGQTGTDAALKQRVEQLEEQLVDMQVIVGTLESLARGGTSAAPSATSSGADDVRIDGLETQVRALAAQLEQLTTQVRALAAQPRRADAAGAQPEPPGAEANEQKDTSRFGSTTVTAGTGDAIGGLIDRGPEPNTPGPGALAAAPADVTPGAPADRQDPKHLYETAYGYLMQRDYGAAQTAFEKFLTHYPKDSLAGNAQYWLGEAHFVRGEYKAAAGAFLKGYQDYAGNARAVDSLLKLAMSLDRLGQKDAACSSFAELTTRFPNAPENVKSRAKSERQRIGCP